MNMNNLYFYGTFILIGAMWWTFYVVPQDNAKSEIMNCMQTTNDRSYENYERCFKKLKANR